MYVCCFSIYKNQPFRKPFPCILLHKSYKRWTAQIFPSKYVSNVCTPFLLPLCEKKACSVLDGIPPLPALASTSHTFLPVLQLSLSLSRRRGSKMHPTPSTPVSHIAKKPGPGPAVLKQKSEVFSPIESGLWLNIAPSPLRIFFKKNNSSKKLFLANKRRQIARRRFLSGENKRLVCGPPRCCR